MRGIVVQCLPTQIPVNAFIRLDLNVTYCLLIPYDQDSTLIQHRTIPKIRLLQKQFVPLHCVTGMCPNVFEARVLLSVE